MQHELIVETLKTRLDKYLAEQLPAISRSQIQRDIEGGCVEVNGAIVTESKFVVRINDKIVYKPSEVASDELKATNTPLKILYNNHGLLIIDKPAGMTVHPGAGFKGETLASALLFMFKDIHLVGEDHRPGIVHRLDKETSGVILVATTPEMYEHLKDAFLERKVKKEYIALVYGKLEKSYGFIETPIGKSKSDFRKQTTKNPVEGKEAITEYKVLEELRHGVDIYTLIRVKLHTGRTHQIRVHLNSIGNPLMGDSLYGNKKTVLKGLDRQFLHAKKIEVQLPSKTWIEAESELADDLKDVLKSLGSKIVNQL
ncbi:MAG TPA: RluA family pseudouridine synthase [Candidatus Limnocylindria bacterium]|nr:RluA family pseudouridine synthase [Candidatus Limnocylindria bacterium]